MSKLNFYPEGIRRLIRRENARIKRAGKRRNGGGGDLFNNPEYYERDEIMAKLHLEMLKGVLADCLNKQVADLTPEDWEIAGGCLEVNNPPGLYGLNSLGAVPEADTATTIFHCHSGVQAKG